MATDFDTGTTSARRIVVAEDESIIRMDIVATLRESGYEVVGQASNGEDAVTLARELKPDIVVLDIEMPTMDGITAAGHIAQTTDSAIVMLTAFSQADLIAKASDAGVMGYVVKPFTGADLIPAVELAWSRYEEHKALREQVTDLTDQLRTRKAVDRAKGLLMSTMGLAEDEAFRWIQRTAMDKRSTMRAVADGIVEALADESDQGSKQGRKRERG